MAEVEKQMDDELAQVIEAGTAAIRDPALNVQEVTAKRYHSVLTSGPAVHESKKPQAIEIARRYSELLVGALRRCEFGSIDGLLSKFWNEYRYAGLSQPVVEPTPRERWAVTFTRWGWIGEEIDAAIARIKPEESGTVRVDWDHFVVGGRTITREAIRLGLKPRFSSDSDVFWLNRFPQMRRAKLDHGDIVFDGTGSA